MIQLATEREARREISRRRARVYSGRGFGPRSFECIGPGIGIGLASYGKALSVPFNGDFSTLAASFGLTVRGDWRGDAGTSGSQGTGIASWANQTGSASAITPGVTTNGVGSVTAGLNGKASVVSDGLTQGGVMTMPAQVAPATVNFHKWWVGRQPTYSAAGGVIFHSDSFGPNATVTASQGSPNANVLQYNFGSGVTTTGVVINQWYRGRLSYTGSASDQIRIGAHAPTPTITSNTAPGATTRGVFAMNSGGGSKLPYELLRYMEIEGPLASFLSFDAAASAGAQTWWTNAIEI